MNHSVHLPLSSPENQGISGYIPQAPPHRPCCLPEVPAVLMWSEVRASTACGQLRKSCPVDWRRIMRLPAALSAVPVVGLASWCSPFYARLVRGPASSAETEPDVVALALSRDRRPRAWYVATSRLASEVALSPADPRQERGPLSSTGCGPMAKWLLVTRAILVHPDEIGLAVSR